MWWYGARQLRLQAGSTAGVCLLCTRHATAVPGSESGKAEAVTAGMVDLNLGNGGEGPQV